MIYCLHQKLKNQTTKMIYYFKKLGFKINSSKNIDIAMNFSK